MSFAGPSASGKTFLGAAIANRQIDLGNPALFVTASDLFDHLRQGFDSDADIGFVDLFEQVRNAPLLILDDLPARAATPWTQERLYQLLAGRHTARLPTVITLRGSPNRLDDFLRTRIQSRDGFSKLYHLGTNISDLGPSLGKIPPNMRRRMTFDNFDSSGNGRLTVEERQSLSTTKVFMRNWVQLPTNWLLLVGSEGAGKTHLAVAAAAARQDSGDEVFFSSVADLLGQLRSAFDPDSPISHNELLEHIKTVELLVLDDMGAERNTPFAEEKLFQIVDYRHAEQLPTIITTSRLDVIERHRSRILARLRDRLFVTQLMMTAPDYRQGGPH